MKGSWLPIASISSLVSNPFSIKICKKDFVVWKSSDSDKWCVQDDICPHRLAPLSRGRVNEDGCIECPYHGWSFNSDGNLVNIPQSNKLNLDDKLGTYTTKVYGDLLWAFLDVVQDEYQDDLNCPSTYYNDLFGLEDSQVFVRELPYSVDILLENFMDPAHIPFAHHGLQAVRSDGCIIPMKMKTNTFKKLEIYFEDVIMGKDRRGILCVTRPCSYNFRTFDNVTNKLDTKLKIFFVPVHEGLSRIFMIPPFSKKMPTVLSHWLSNKFLNTDIWLHDVEYNLRVLKKPEMFRSSSDFGPRAFRTWFDNFDLKSNLPGSFGTESTIKRLSKKDQLDNRKYHIDNCKHCKKKKYFFLR